MEIESYHWLYLKINNSEFRLILLDHITYTLIGPVIETLFSIIILQSWWIVIKLYISLLKLWLKLHVIWLMDPHYFISIITAPLPIYVTVDGCDDDYIMTGYWVESGTVIMQLYYKHIPRYIQMKIFRSPVGINSRKWILDLM